MAKGAIRLKEGFMNKGQVNEKPSTPRPPHPPQGQFAKKVQAGQQ